MKRTRILAGAAAVLALGGTASAIAMSAASARTDTAQGPHIVARPDSVMVNTSTTLHGSGFGPHRKVLLWECSVRTWVVPMKVCRQRNAVTVRTNANGRFTVKFTVLVCPKPPAALAGFSRTCYIGEPKIQGVDTVTLIGAAKITVTGPQYLAPRR